MKPTNLLKHRRQYLYDRAIPKALQPIIGKTRFRIPLGTGDLNKALLMKPRCDHQFSIKMQKAQRQLTGTPDTLEKLEALATDFKRRFADWDQDGISYNSAELEDHWPDLLPSQEEHFEDLILEKAPKSLPVLCEEYLASLKGISLNTVLERRSSLRKFQRWCSDRSLFNMLKFTRADARAFVSSLEGNPATIGKQLQGPRGLWRYMEEEGIEDIDWAIWGKLAPKKSQLAKNDNRERAFTLTELRKLFQGAPRPDLKDAMLLALYSGMRLGEVGYLRAEHIDLDKLTINVPGTKNANSLRTIPIHPRLIKVLSDRMVDKGARDFILHELGDKPLKHGRKRSAALSQAFTRYRESVGVSDDRDGIRRSLVNYHSFRRTSATAMTEASPPVPEDVINKFHGWSSQGSMRGRYTITAELMSHMRKALDALDWPIDP